MDTKVGPTGPGTFPPDATVTCTYLKKKIGGGTPKFACVIRPDDEVKVKFGPSNGEVFAEVAATRLFWALGFGADRVYPVRVVCHGCPSSIRGTEMASIQRKMPAKDIETAKGSGWGWPELDLVDPAVGGAPQAQRDALKLLAVVIQHTDSKPEQQRLICRRKHDKRTDGKPCLEPFMRVHDLGQTFGHANTFNRDAEGSVNLEEWSRAPIWRDTQSCVAHQSKSASGTLDNPVISDEGRTFLADLLAQLTDTQLRDLFVVARFPRRSTTTDASPDTTTIDQWVDAFKQKRNEVVNRTCPG